MIKVKVYLNCVVFSLLIGLLFFYPSSAYAQSQSNDADSLLKTAVEYFNIKESTKSEYYFDLAIQAFITQKDTASAFDAYVKMGRRWYRFGNFNKAESIYVASVPFKTSTVRESSLFIFYITYARIKRKLNDTAAAFSYLTKGLQIAEQSQSKNRRIYIYSEMANNYEYLGLYNKAIELNKKASKLSGETGKLLTQAKLLNNIASNYEYKGEYRDALFHYEQSIEIRKQMTPIPSLETPYYNIALLYQDINRPQLALTNLNTALQYILKNETLDMNKLSLMYFVKYQIFNRLHLSDSAHYYFAKSDSIARTNQLSERMIYNAFSLARSYLEQENISEAEKTLEEIAPLFSSISLTLIDYHLSIKASIASKKNDLQSLYQYYQELENILPALRPIAQLHSQFTFARLFERFDPQQSINIRTSLFERLSQLQYELYFHSNNKDALFTSFLPDIKRSLVFFHEQGMPTKELFYYANFLSTRVVESERKTNLAELPFEDRARVLQLSDSLEKARLDWYLSPDSTKNERLLFLTKLERSYYNLTESLFQKSISQPIPLTSIQQQLPSDKLLIQSVVSDSTLLQLYLTSSTAQARMSRIPNLSQTIETFTTSIAQKEDLSVVHSLGRALYEQMWAKDESFMFSYSDWVIIPDGELTNVPFEAFVKTDTYLSELVTLTYCPSLTLYKDLLNRTTSPSYSAELLQASNPIISENQREVSLFEISTSLPFASIEASSVRSFFEKEQINWADRQFVSESNFVTSLQNTYRYVHIAAHGVSHPTIPELSGLILGTDNENDSDGFWTLNEIKMQYIPSKLVILSACETGFGRTLRGENSLGLSQAFLIAGAENILATMWKINDRSSATFVASLFQKLTQRDKKQSSFLGKVYASLALSESSMSNARLLHSVKREMIKHEEYNHPYYWAPFVLIGT